MFVLKDLKLPGVIFKSIILLLSFGFKLSALKPIVLGFARTARVNAEIFLLLFFLLARALVYEFLLGDYSTALSSDGLILKIIWLNTPLIFIRHY